MRPVRHSSRRRRSGDWPKRGRSAARKGERRPHARGRTDDERWTRGRARVEGTAEGSDQRWVAERECARRARCCRRRLSASQKRPDDDTPSRLEGELAKRTEGEQAHEISVVPLLFIMPSLYLLLSPVRSGRVPTFFVVGAGCAVKLRVPGVTSGSRWPALSVFQVSVTPAGARRHLPQLPPNCKLQLSWPPAVGRRGTRGGWPIARSSSNSSSSCARLDGGGDLPTE